MIFNLFKSKPTLRELIPDSFIDIHSHILPGIDDGAKNIDHSKILIIEMKKLGFKKIYGTPHTFEGIHNNTSESILKSYKNLIENLDIDIEINYSSEYLLDINLVKKAQNKDILTLKENLILIEFSYINKLFFILN